MPAAEPGHVQRPGRDQVHRAKRTFAKPVALSTEVLLDRERCVSCARCTRFAEQIAGDPLIELLERGPEQQVGIADGRAVRLLLLRQHRADLPGRRADRRRLPVPGPAVRPGVRRPASASTARRAAGSAPTTGAAWSPAGWRATTPQVNEEWNCDKGRWAFTYATQPDRLAGPLVRDADGVLRPASWPEAIAAAARGLLAARGRAGGAHRRQAHPGGRLRLRQVRPARPGQQRHRHAGAPALGRGDASSWPPAWPAPGIGVSYADLERAPAVLLAGLRARGRVADRLPAAAQGRRARDPGRLLASPRWPATGWPSCPGMLLPTVPGAEAEVLGQPGRPGPTWTTRAAPRPRR